MANYFDTSVEFIKGVGPRRARLLQKELGIYTFGDLVQHYPFRYEDRTRVYAINELNESMPHVQVCGKVLRWSTAGGGQRKRLVAYFQDSSGELELVWFRGTGGIRNNIKPGVEYLVFGKPSRYAGHISMAHPEMDLVSTGAKQGFLQPVYPLSEKLRSKYLNNRHLVAIQRELLQKSSNHFHETLSEPLLQKRQLISKRAAMAHIHFPTSHKALASAQYRLKFEELFYIQMQLITMRSERQRKYKGLVFDDTKMLTQFYAHHLSFSLTSAQKRVVHEIYADLKSGRQMNRLLQGDVGSGKTIVAFICMLLAIEAGTQVALMAPTEILARQHYGTLKEYADAMKISIALLTGATKKKIRTALHTKLKEGELNILVGTHAIIEDEVQFKQLGLAIIDEQHRFGVAQRSKLWKKNREIYPHMLVMTATPIPRTLAMTLYGDLDISTIDELPKGRKPIQTVHRYDAHRLRINRFISTQVAQGRQVYIVYPLIEESEKLDLKHLMDGYESITRAFPKVPISIVHGKMKAEAKAFEMRRFVQGETKIMVATTVIEVGVDIPNASVMIVENAERFGLSQLHQLRGRVGRGTAQSYCILVTDYKLGADSKIRMETMERTNDGFEIAETDLQLRGPGDLIGTQQSGALDLLIADLGKDGRILQAAREDATQLIALDPELKKDENKAIKTQIEATRKGSVNWSRIS